MIEDRDYMRETPGAPGRTLTVKLILINAVVFLIQLGLQKARLNFPLDRYFALSLDGLRQGFVWQLLTFQFLHGGLLHLLLNSWGIYVFGRAVEEALGKSRFLQLYLSSGAIGGLLHVGCSYFLPQHFGGLMNDGSHVPVVGASAGLYGLIAAFAGLFPDQRLTLLLFFVLPLTLTARALLLASAAIAIFGIALATDNVAHGAHLGGMWAGYLLIRWGDRLRLNLSNWHPLQARQRKRELVRAAAVRGRPWRTTPTETEPELPPDEFISREVDPILDKISAHGIQSLTDRERKILETARKKMGKR
ncbi:MAG: rhomboid family intramembrane serine protease [Verrucomicrobia bacterium]|jgi:membrane associated rhomboid family serine protease|nr:rhomboid family intramembrane serine protease [Verrucomicrobiota bacterium]